MSKQINYNFSDCRFFLFATGGAPWAANIFLQIYLLLTALEGLGKHYFCRFYTISQVITRKTQFSPIQWYLNTFPKVWPPPFPAIVQFPRRECRQSACRMHPSSCLAVSGQSLLPLVGSSALVQSDTEGGFRSTYSNWSKDPMKGKWDRLWYREHVARWIAMGSSLGQCWNFRTIYWG
jgi:hypothetical protein